MTSLGMNIHDSHDQEEHGKEISPDERIRTLEALEIELERDLAEVDRHLVQNGESDGHAQAIDINGLIIGYLGLVRSRYEDILTPGQKRRIEQAEKELAVLDLNRTLGKRENDAARHAMETFRDIVWEAYSETMAELTHLRQNN